MEANLSRGPGIVRKQRVVTDICDISQIFDRDSVETIRRYRNGYPKEGYDVTKSNPFAPFVEARKPPPLRGC